ncbi:MAG: RNA methyltransferase [Bacteroidia bacterium]
MLGKNRISELQSLHQKKFRIQKNRFFAEGRKTVSELLQQGYPILELYAGEDFINNHKTLLDKLPVQSIEISEQELLKISALKNPDEAFAVCQIPNKTLPELHSDETYLFLDSIRDPGNLGSILRLADWFGVKEVIVSDDCVEWTNPKVIQASMGSFMRKQPYVADSDFWSQLPQNLQLIAADLQGENLYTDFKGFAGMFIISNEANGLSDYLLEKLNKTIHIPSPEPSAESLNAAMATGVILGELNRRKFWNR